MRRADRLFRLVQLLRSRRLVTAAQLAEELSVSVRTVYRDVRDLEESGVPIRGEAGVGYALQRGYELPPLTFNTAEIEALVLGMRMVQAHGDPDLADAAGSALTKVEAVIPSALREVLLKTALFAPGRRRPSPQWLGPLRKAIADRQKVHMTYERPNGETSERAVRPLGLYFWGVVWSMAAWCELRKDYRNFRIDRIVTLDVLDQTFDATEGPSLDGFIDAMRAHDER